jgi:hypothetical protein
MKKIYFVDKWQDLLWVVIDDKGVITDCNMQGFVWIGMRVVLKKLAIGKGIVMLDSELGLTRYDFVVEKIETLK